MAWAEMNTEDNEPMNSDEEGDGIDRVGDLFKAYIAEHKSEGAADPTPFLAQVEGHDRDELVALIDAFLVRSPGRRWNPEAMQGSFAERVKIKFEEVLNGESGNWPELLPSLRNAAELPRSAVVEKLADAIGVAGSEEKVARYYNEMEHGTLPASGVSDRVLEALAKIMGTTFQTLRTAGDELGHGRKDVDSRMFARRASSRDSGMGMASPGIAPESRMKGVEAESDEVDRLFTGGSGS